METGTMHQVIVSAKQRRGDSLQSGHIEALFLVTHSSSALVVIFHLAFTLEDRHLFSVCQHFLLWLTKRSALEYQFLSLYLYLPMLSLSLSLSLYLSLLFWFPVGDDGDVLVSIY